MAALELRSRERFGDDTRSRRRASLRASARDRVVDAISDHADRRMLPLQQRQRGRQPLLAAHVDQDDVRLARSACTGEFEIEIHVVDTT